MKKAIVVVTIVVCFMIIITGCKQEKEVSNKSSKSVQKSEESVEDVFVGTWDLYGWFDQGGSFVTSQEAGFEGSQSFTFEKDDSFSAVFDQGSTFNSTILGTYDYSESQKADSNPYNWYYYLSVDEDTIQDLGDYGYLSRMGNEGMYFTFKFRELEGEKYLFDDGRGVYYKKR